ncbi:MAG: ParA family protein [Syntrophobacteraceae bacterium]|jgi:chromosome partitioning protein
MMSDTRIVAILSLKGGVGKTTSAVNIACCLAQAGKKTLLVDLDPYTGATSHLGIKLEPSSRTVTDVLCNPNGNISEAIYKTATANLYVAASDESLASCESEFNAEIGKESILFERFAGHASEYDFVIMDLPPVSPFLMVNALRMSRDVLVPFRTAYLDLKVAEDINELVEKVRRRLNPDIRILGYFGTMSNLRTKESRLSVEDMRRRYGDKVFRTVIPACTRVAEAPRSGVSVTEYAGSSTGAKAYRDLVKEIFDV